MDKERLEQVRYHTQFQIVKNSITRINPEFSLCTVLVAYHGDNRNYSSISKEVFEKCLWTIYGIPIVGEWVRPEEDPSKETWGSHGGRIILDDQGIKYEQTTKPFGFVTEEAYKNAQWVEVIEKDGHTKNEYLKLERCILWNSRYDECDSILEDNFGQSMELRINDGHYRDDHFFVITDFVFSALCILGTAEPCFESAMIGRQYELSQFKREFQLMMESYKKFNTDYELAAESETQAEPPKEESEVVSEEPADVPATPVEETQNNSVKEEGAKLGKILFSDVCEKIKVLLAEHSYRYRTGKQYDKYMVLSVSEADKAIIVVDREDSYSVFKLPYVATKTKEGLVVNIDYDNKVEMALGGVEKTVVAFIEPVFSVKEEVESIAKEVSTYDVGIYSNARINELMVKLEDVTGNFETAQARIIELEGHLGVFENEKKHFMAQKHKDIIDTLIASRREEMGKFSEYLDYCIEIDYSKSIEQVEKEIKEIHYNYMVKNQSGGKKTFSAIEVPVASGFETDGNTIADRYGDDIAKYFK